MNGDRGPEAGFSLIELIFAIMILSFGVLAVVSTVAMGTRRQSLAASRVEMAMLADSKLERMRGAATSRTADTVQLNVGGSLTTSLASYVDTVTAGSGRRYVRRWEVAAGPGTTRSVTLRVLPLTDQLQTAAQLDFSTLILVLT